MNEMKINTSALSLKIDEIDVFNTNFSKGICFSWSGTLGCGQYLIYQKENGEWFIDSEGMDKNDDKSFGMELLEFWLKEVTVTG